MLPIHKIIWHEAMAAERPERRPEPEESMDDLAQVRSYVQAYAWSGPTSALQLCHLRSLAGLIRPGDTVVDLACGPGPLADSVRFGLETGNCAFEDTFMPYFFSHPRDFLAAGFIGILAGKGQGDDTDYQPASMGPGGDGGWFFGKLKEFDRGRPWLP